MAGRPPCGARYPAYPKLHAYMEGVVSAQEDRHAHGERGPKERDGRGFEPALARYANLLAIKKEHDEARELAEEAGEDAALRAMAEEELASLEGKLVEEEGAVVDALLARDEDATDDSRSVVLEVRMGVGGDEAALFASQIFHMYEKLAQAEGWTFETHDISTTDLKGYREATAEVVGHRAYTRLQFEAGVHRVQRVPGHLKKMHTSTATVVVYPQPTEGEVVINDADLKFETMRAGGAGGQHVNTTDSAVRVTHVPTGIVVVNQDERSQHKNKAKALSVLRARLFTMERERQLEELSAERTSQIAGSQRNEKIRTYNFPQNRVTDHRCGMSLFDVENLVDGAVGLPDMLDALETWQRDERIKALFRNM